MLRFYSHFLFLFIHWCVLSPCSYATHMVGGEITYRCLGNSTNLYEIKLTVFRDCDTGVPWFDDPVAIGIFDSRDSLVYDLRIPLSSQDDTLSLDLDNPCLIVPPNVCIHTTTYVDTVSLPFTTGGYQITYQRCCRNQSIVNIINPLGTGATYSAYISEEALLTCNSSPVFKQWPQVYICAGVPINFDHSATDADGDSIVYELCTPLAGASPLNAIPQPPSNPPYDTVNWNPPYGLGNMLNGPDPIRIHPATGLLTGTPSDMGVFVVGICANEYRNGVLISSTRRDFQYAVGICGLQVVSAFFTPAVQCDNSLIVSFDNNSQVQVGDYQWDFGDSANPGPNSSLENPVYIYPDTGYYDITLVADPNLPCADTTTQTIYLQYESILTNFALSTISCSDSLEVMLNDLTIDSISTISDWFWDFGNGDTDTVPLTSTVYDTSGRYIIKLTVTASNGCQEQHSDTLDVALLTILDKDTVAICEGFSDIVLNQGGNPNYQYQWLPSTGLSSTTASSPIASPSTTTTYTVTVTDFDGLDTCMLVRQITVVVSPPRGLSTIDDRTTCEDSITLHASGTSISRYEWSYSPDFSSIVSHSDSLVLDTLGLGTNTVYVRAIDTLGCQFLDTVSVLRQDININADFSYSTVSCGEEFVVQFTDISSDFSQGTIVDWSWNFENGHTSSLQNPLDTFIQSGTYDVRLQIASELGCTGLVSYPVSIHLPTISSNDTVGICQGQHSVTLNPNGNSSYQYQWFPATGLSSATIASPVASPSVATTYTVTVTSISGLDTCSVVRNTHVNFPPPILVDVPSLQTYCGACVELTATSPTAVSYEWAGDSSFFPLLSTNNPDTFCPSTFPYAAYNVRATDAYGCTASNSAQVEQVNIPVNVDFSYNSLGCASTMDVQFTDRTNTAGVAVQSWLWTNSDGQSSSRQHPIFTFAQHQDYIISLEVLLSNGCSGIHIDTIDVSAAEISSELLVGLCDGATQVELNEGGDTNLIYQWSGQGLSNTTIANPIATPPSTPYIYTVTVTGLSSLDTCVAVYTITLASPPPLYLDIAEDTTFCESPIRLGANHNGNTLEWALDSNFNFVALVNANPVFVNFGSIPSTFVLYVRTSDRYGCSMDKAVALNYSTSPVNVDFAMHIQSCSEDLAVEFTDLTSDTLISSIASWNWSFSNGLSFSGQHPSITYNGDGPHYANLTVTLDNGCLGNRTDSLFYDLPFIYSPDSIGLCGDSSIVLNPNGNPNFQYQWAPATGLSDARIASPTATLNTNQMYTVTVTAFNTPDTCVLVDTVLVKADELTLEAAPDNALICNKQIDLRVNSVQLDILEWALDSSFNLVLGFTNPFAVNVHDDRWFYVRGRDAFGCTAMDSVFVRIKDSPILAEFSTSPVYCGDSLILDFLDITSDTVDNPITEWNWNLGNGQTASIPNPRATYNNTGSYTVSMDILTQNGCVAFVSRLVDLNLPLFEAPDNRLVVCLGESAELNPNANPNLDYEWSPPWGLDNPLAKNPIVSPSASTTYNVITRGSYSIDGVSDTCTTSARVYVVVPDTLIVAIQGDSLSCADKISLEAVSNTARDYLWSDVADFSNVLGTDSNLLSNIEQDTSVLYVRVNDDWDCLAEDSTEIIGQILKIRGDTVSICAGDLTSLNVETLIGASRLTYTWSPQSQIISGQGTASISSAPSSDVVFEVIAENSHGCLDTAYAQIWVAGTYPILNLTSAVDSISAGESVRLSVDQNPNYSYVWQENSSLDIDDIYAPLASPKETTTYYLTVLDNWGCSISDSISIKVKKIPCEEPHIFVPNAFTPNGDEINDYLYVRGNGIQRLYFAIYNRWGEKVFETTQQHDYWDGSYNGRMMDSGVFAYYLECECIGGTQYFKKGNITLVR